MQKRQKLLYKLLKRGHLVFATIHASSNPTALLRLIDLGIRPFLIASALNIVVSQRLVRKLCKHCKNNG